MLVIFMTYLVKSKRKIVFGHCEYYFVLSESFLSISVSFLYVDHSDPIGLCSDVFV